MALSLTKPNEGAVGWSSGINQNWTDLETKVLTVPHSDSASSTGPSSTGVEQTIGTGYTVPANTFAQDGDMLRVSYYMNRGGSAGSATYNARVGSSSLAGLNVTQTVGTAVEFFQEVIIIRTGSNTVKCIQRSNWLNNGTGYSAAVLTTVGSLDFASTILIDARVTESATTNATTRLMFFVERVGKS